MCVSVFEGGVRCVSAFEGGVRCVSVFDGENEECECMRERARYVSVCDGDNEMYAYECVKKWVRCVWGMLRYVGVFDGRDEVVREGEVCECVRICV